MLWTGLIIAALLVAQDPIIVQAQDVPSTDVAPVNVEGARLENGTNTRASDPADQVICRNRPITGSRFNHRRCRTRSQASIARAEAQRYMVEATRSGPSTDAILDGGPGSAGPQ